MIKRIISAVILSFLLCVSLTGAVICMSAKSTWLNQEYALSELGVQDYYNVVYETILSDFESIGIPSGIPADVFAEALSRDTINQDIRRSVESLYTNKAFTVDTATLKENLSVGFKQYARSINANIYEQSVKDSLEKLTDYCASQYGELIKLPFMSELSPYVSKAVKLADAAAIGCIALSAVLIALLVVICRELSVQYIGTALIGSGLICLIPSAAVLTGALYKNINLGIEVFYKFAVNFIEHGLNAILSASIIMIITGVIANVAGVFITSVIVKNKRRLRNTD